MMAIRAAAGIEQRANETARHLRGQLEGPLAARARAEGWDGRDLLIGVMILLKGLCIDFDIPPSRLVGIMKGIELQPGGSDLGKMVQPGGRDLADVGE